MGGGNGYLIIWKMTLEFKRLLALRAKVHEKIMN